MVRKKKLNIKKCSNCLEDKPVVDFYVTKNKLFIDGRVPICKECIKSTLDYNDTNSIYTVLKQLDLPFLYKLWSNCVKSKTDTLGSYVRQINSLSQYSGLTWKDSVFGDSTDNNEEKKKSSNKNSIKKNNYKGSVSDDMKSQLIDKWGWGYTDEELLSFEKKYDLLKDNYPERTAMHTEALLNYIRYQVKAEIATSRGDVVSAQKWGALADKASIKAKINPSQLSKADLTGGLSGFGELVRAIEQAVDVIEVLPRFRERPQDKADFTLWCYINYIRRMKNLPDVEYKDIYAFYEERKKEYEHNIDDGFFENGE